jgi:hypothetical protein
MDYWIYPEEKRQMLAPSGIQIDVPYIITSSVNINTNTLHRAFIYVGQCKMDTQTILTMAQANTNGKRKPGS